MKRHWGILKKSLVIIFFLALAALSFRAVDRLLMIRSQHGIDQMRCFYDQVRDSIDVLFLGSSHVHVDINTGTLWEEFGIASYDLSGAEQPLWMTYHVMKEALKTQTPRLMVLECYAPSVFHDDFHPDWIDENVMGMRFSINKLQMMSVSLKSESWASCFPGFAVWHHRYGQLGEEDWKAFLTTAKDRRVFKGYTPYFRNEPQERITGIRDDTQGLSYKSQVYLTKIFDLCEEKEIPLYVIVSPYVVRSELAASSQREMGDMAEERELYFINYNSDEALERMDLDFATDLCDHSHLNYLGSVKYTRCLGRDIRQFYDIPDRRGEKDNKCYESWERNAADIHRQAQENGYE